MLDESCQFANISKKLELLIFDYPSSSSVLFIAFLPSSCSFDRV